MRHESRSACSWSKATQNLNCLSEIQRKSLSLPFMLKQLFSRMHHFLGLIWHTQNMHRSKCLMRMPLCMTVTSVGSFKWYLPIVQFFGASNLQLAGRESPILQIQKNKPRAVRAHSEIEMWDFPHKKFNWKNRLITVRSKTFNNCFSLIKLSQQRQLNSAILKKTRGNLGQTTSSWMVRRVFRIYIQIRIHITQ